MSAAMLMLIATQRPRMSTVSSCQAEEWRLPADRWGSDWVCVATAKLLSPSRE